MILTLRKRASTLLSALLAAHLLLENVDEVFVESTLEQTCQDAGQGKDYADGESDRCPMDVLVAELKIVVHARGPGRCGIGNCCDGVCECELAIVRFLSIECVQVQGFVRFEISVNLFALGVRACFDLKAHDAVVLAVGDRLCLDNDVPVVVERILTIDKCKAKWNAIVVVSVHGAIRLAHFHGRGQTVHVYAEAVVMADHLLEVYDLNVCQVPVAGHCVQLVLAHFVLHERKSIGVSRSQCQDHQDRF